MIAPREELTELAEATDPCLEEAFTTLPLGHLVTKTLRFINCNSRLFLLQHYKRPASNRKSHKGSSWRVFELCEKPFSDSPESKFINVNAWPNSFTTMKLAREAIAKIC